METSKKKLCVLIHFSNGSFIPYYVQIFANELALFFDEVILIGNKREVFVMPENLNSKITILFETNEGYDFGMFYKALQTVNLSEYNQIACVNDSNILFNKLDTIFNWGNATNFDFWGLIDSYQKPKISIHTENYHIQSHFMVFNQKAILNLINYLKNPIVKSILNERDLKKCRNAVINFWEIGLTQYFIKNDLSVGSFIDSVAFSKTYLGGKKTNISIKLYRELIKDNGYPLIKKKVITRSFLPFSLGLSNHWKNIIKKYGNQQWNIEKLLNELVNINIQALKSKFFVKKVGK